MTGDKNHHFHFTTMARIPISTLDILEKNKGKGECLVSNHPLTISHNNPLDWRLCGSQSQFESGGKRNFRSYQKLNPGHPGHVHSLYCWGYIGSHHAYSRDEFYLKQSIPERNVTVPCSQEGLSSKMFATVSRHVEHFSAEENSIKVWHISLAAPVDGGICTDRVQNLLK